MSQLRTCSPSPCSSPTHAVVLEGTATSLMSKVIWSGFAMGVLNAGALHQHQPAPQPFMACSACCTSRSTWCLLCPLQLSIPAGLLSTEAGTLGRFVGNGLLAAAGKLTGLESLTQLAAFGRLLFLTLAGVCVALLAHLACTYRRLQG